MKLVVILWLTEDIENVSPKSFQSPTPFATAIGDIDDIATLVCKEVGRVQTKVDFANFGVHQLRLHQFHRSMEAFRRHERIQEIDVRRPFLIRVVV
jgi:hypothetical protein